MKKTIEQLRGEILNPGNRTGKTMSLTRFGTYGFLSMLLASQVSLANNVSDSAERAVVDTKKEARSARRQVKKTARKVTGNQSTWEDVKDKTKDGIENTKEELELPKHKEK